MENVEKYDKNMVAAVLSDENFNYYDIKQAPFSIEGLAWFKQEHAYFRLPLNCKDKVSEAVYWLSSHPAGGQLRFRSDSNLISIKVKLPAPSNMTHMSAVGQTGFDLYYKETNQTNYQFFTSTNYPFGSLEYTITLFKSDFKATRDFIINFPLYMGVKEVLIGFEKDATVLPAIAHKHQKKAVVYGTSVTQGGCASRPGMAYTNILSRWLDMEFINLGFSGSGLGEPIMAKLMTEIEDVGLFVLDYDANGGCTGMLEKHMEEFITILREKYPLVPILVITKPPFSNYVFSKEERKLRERLFLFQKNMVKKFKKQGDQNIHFFSGAKIFGKEEIMESTVDGLHPTDLGFYRMSKALYPTFNRLINH